MTMQNRPRLGLILDETLTVVFISFCEIFSNSNLSMAQVLSVVQGGACSGQLDVGDRITRVNDVSVVGKEPKDAQAVFESSCTSLGKVILHIDRPGKGVLHRSA
jgi:hypothetical protein